MLSLKEAVVRGFDSCYLDGTVLGQLLKNLTCKTSCLPGLVSSVIKILTLKTSVFIGRESKKWG